MAAQGLSTLCKFEFFRSIYHLVAVGFEFDPLY